jgi:C-8 sterol isomerase
VLLIALAIGCGDTSDETNAADDDGPAATADIRELDQFLDEDGAPDRTSILRAYEWLKALVASAPQDDAYEFSPEELHEVAQLGVGLPVDQAWNVIHQELMRRHPGKIKEVPRWTFNSSGAAFCQLALVYASTKEYVAFFGTPIGADGFSGRYKTEVWDLMVDGEMWTYVPGQFDKTVYLAGDLAYLPKGGGKAVRYVDHAWMIDYARGSIITMFPFGLIAPTLFVTLDYQSAWEQFVDFGQLVIQNLLHP